MTLLAIAVLVTGITLLNIYNISHGQTMEYPNTFLEPVQFDSSYIRGAFNMSECMKELMTCWELIRPDTACRPIVYYESVCSHIRDYCHDEYGDLELYWFFWYYKNNYTIHLEDCDKPTPVS
ncbi:uncharacterized protein LOC142979219 [Anticarsia gemmatalis]|uniref:uncharacterized protein LOC142979219 n=1 Tax=Anticarsia gemmatalis TaxID=129554 RepID=UPI003F76E8AB